MRKGGTTLTSWARAIRRALDEAGLDSAALFDAAGLDRAALADPNARYSVADTNRLWALAVRATGDEALGLTVCRYVTPTTFHALGYSLQASSTLDEAFERCERYFRVVSDAVALSFRKEGGDCCLSIEVAPGRVRPADESLDAFAAVLVRLCRALYGRDLSPSRVRLQRKKPRVMEPYARAFRAPLEFEAAATQLVYARTPFEQPLAGSNPELARQNDAVAARYLSRFQRDDVAGRLRGLLVEALPHGEPSQSGIAHALHMSERSLQRRLTELGTNYKAVLDGTRQELALSYVQDRSYTIGEITYLLGFTEASSFTRAFRRWAGCSPTEYRATKE